MQIGVYVCHCGLNIAGVLDIDAIVAYAQELRCDRGVRTGA
jgi:heterodisulfide reductase subunit A